VKTELIQYTLYEINMFVTRDILRIKDWCDKWSMCLNSSKFKIMHLGKKNPSKKYYIEESKSDLNFMLA
jgi:hypothetical protein